MYVCVCACACVRACPCVCVCVCMCVCVCVPDQVNAARPELRGLLPPRAGAALYRRHPLSGKEQWVAIYPKLNPEDSNVRTHVCICQAFMYISLHVCTYVYICTCIHTYIYIHRYIHMQCTLHTHVCTHTYVHIQNAVHTYTECVYGSFLSPLSFSGHERASVQDAHRARQPEHGGQVDVGQA